jgi:lactate permease
MTEWLANLSGQTATIGQRGRIFRRVVGYSAGILAFLCLLVRLQSTAALSWMPP